MKPQLHLASRECLVNSTISDFVRIFVCFLKVSVGIVLRKRLHSTFFVHMWIYVEVFAKKLK